MVIIVYSQLDLIWAYDIQSVDKMWQSTKGEAHMEEKYIDFAADEWYDHHRRKIVWFSATVDQKSIDCGISIEALRDHFGAYYDDPLPAFRTNRTRIHETATKLIIERRFEDDGTVLIQSADL